MSEPENPRSLLKLSINNSAASCAHMFSPMTDLAHNLGGLSTGCISTPTRRISWSSNSSASSTPCSIASDDAAFSCSSDKVANDFNSPSNALHVKDSRILGDITAQSNSGSNRQQSQRPTPFFLPSTPVTCFLSSNKENLSGDKRNPCVCSACQGEPVDTASSQDSGYSGSQVDKECTAKTCFNFEAPSLSRRLQLVDDESPQTQGNSTRTRCKRFSSCNDFIEEDYLEDLIGDELVSNEDTQFPSGISKLLESPLTFSEAGISPEETPSRRAFERKFSMPVNATSYEEFMKGEDKLSFKRPEPPHGGGFQIHHKRRRKAVSFCHNDLSPEAHQPMFLPQKFPQLQRCHSETEANIKQAIQLTFMEPNLIGDASRPYALPLVPGKHEDLKCIEPVTVKLLLEGHYQDTIDRHLIVDCRYPYEYEGGHIKGARNIYTKDGIIKEFLSNPPQNSGNQNDRSVIIFHCEFSSERGPSLTRFLRSKDREANKDCYPALHYPEIYLLSGGYKAFYESFKMFCEPQDYKPMNHKDHGAEMRQFRAKSKSWNAESKARFVPRPGLKF